MQKYRSDYQYNSPRMAVIKSLSSAVKFCIKRFFQFLIMLSKKAQTTNK